MLQAQHLPQQVAIAPAKRITDEERRHAVVCKHPMRIACHLFARKGCSEDIEVSAFVKGLPRYVSLVRIRRVGNDTESGLFRCQFVPY